MRGANNMLGEKSGGKNKLQLRVAMGAIEKRDDG